MCIRDRHDSYTPLAGMVTMLLMQLGEVIFGGVGCGLYGMLAFAILAAVRMIFALDGDEERHARMRSSVW